MSTHRELYLHRVLFCQLKARNTVLTLVLSDGNVFASLRANYCCSSDIFVAATTLINAAVMRPRYMPPCGS